MSNLFNFRDETCLITGGASGMGKVFAMEFAKCGADVIVADINLHEAQATADEVSNLTGKKTDAQYLDATVIGSVEAMTDNIIKQYGKIDILVNSIGIGAKPRPEETPADIWNRVMAVNINGVYYCCITIGETMIKRKSGNIINIASMSSTIIPAKTREGKGGEYGLFAYCASKGAVKQLTKALAVTWAPSGVKVNSVSPGYVDTPLTSESHNNPKIRATLESKVPMGYIAAPKDIVGSVLFLASDASEYITGLDLLVDGGYTCW